MTAIYLAIWANGAVTERWGEQPSPFTQSQTIGVAERVQAAGVAWHVAKASVYRQCRESRNEKPPRSPNYFEQGILSDWEGEEISAAAKSSGERAPPPNGKPGRKTPVRPTRDDGDAILVFGQIQKLITTRQQPGQAAQRYIPRAAVESLGPATIAAYDAIGGAERIVSATGDQMGFVLRDFTKAYEAQS